MKLHDKILILQYAGFNYPYSWYLKDTRRTCAMYSRYKRKYDLMNDIASNDERNRQIKKMIETYQDYYHHDYYYDLRENPYKTSKMALAIRKLWLN